MFLPRKSNLSAVLLFFALRLIPVLPSEAESSGARNPNAEATDRLAGKEDKDSAGLAAALRLYESLEYEAALQQLDVARSAALRTDEQVLVSLYEGIILANLGLARRSEEAFRSALRLQPSVTLPIAVSPKIAQAFQDIREDVRREVQTRSESASAFLEPAAPVSPISPAEPSPQAKQETPAPPSTQDRQISSPAPTSVASSSVRVQAPPAAAPWASAQPMSPGQTRPGTAYQAAMAVGGALALGGFIVYGSTDSMSSQREPALRWVSGVVGVSGLVLAGVGLGLQAIHRSRAQVASRRGIQPVLSLRHQGASVGARLSFE